MCACVAPTDSAAPRVERVGIGFLFMESASRRETTASVLRHLRARVTAVTGAGLLPRHFSNSRSELKA